MNSAANISLLILADRNGSHVRPIAARQKNLYALAFKVIRRPRTSWLISIISILIHPLPVVQVHTLYPEPCQKSCRKAIQSLSEQLSEATLDNA